MVGPPELVEIFVHARLDADVLLQAGLFPVDLRKGYQRTKRAEGG